MKEEQEDEEEDELLLLLLLTGERSEDENIGSGGMETPLLAAAAVWGMWYLWFALPQQRSVCVRSLEVPGACRFLRVA